MMSLNMLIYQPYYWIPRMNVHGGYYGVIVVMPPPPLPQTLNRSHDNLQNPYRIASIY